ncbi:hypothetical protein ANMWB30_02780 [Arthrobacter sp. MWB30]|nr:hypothetical protein ANMWB30_02780 [Arthrobacter sp. MWB30]
MAGVDVGLGDGVRCRSRHCLAREQLARSARPGVSQSRQTSQRIRDGNVLQRHVAGVLRRERVGDDVTHDGGVPDSRSVRRLGELHGRARSQRCIGARRGRGHSRTGGRGSRGGCRVRNVTGVDIRLGDCISRRSRDGLAREQLAWSARPGVNQSRQASQRVIDGNVAQLHVAGVLRREGVGDDVADDGRVLNVGCIGRLAEFHGGARSQRSVGGAGRRDDGRTGRRITRGGGRVGYVSCVDVRLRNGVGCHRGDGLARKQSTRGAGPAVRQGGEASQRIGDDNIRQRHISGVGSRERVGDLVAHYSRRLNPGRFRALGERHRRSRLRGVGQHAVNVGAGHRYQRQGSLKCNAAWQIGLQSVGICTGDGLRVIGQVGATRLGQVVAGTSVSDVLPRGAGSGGNGGAGTTGGGVGGVADNLAGGRARTDLHGELISIRQSRSIQGLAQGNPGSADNECRVCRRVQVGDDVSRTIDVRSLGIRSDVDRDGA